MFTVSVQSKKIRFTALGAFKCGKLNCLTWLLAGLPLAATGQQLEAIGATVSLNVTQISARPPIIPLGYYTLLTDEDHSRYDEIGYRLAAYGRWRVGQSQVFIQPEVGYTSSQGQTYLLAYYPPQGVFGPDLEVFAHHLRRWEIAALAGLHTGRHTYVLAGPVLAFNRREATLAVDSSRPVLAVYNSLYQSVEPLQLLGQVGVGFLAERFDFNLRFEQSLTPYSRRLVYDGNSYGYRQRIRQGLFTVGFLLHKAKPQPAAGRE